MLLLVVVYLAFAVLSFGSLRQKKSIWIWKTVLASVLAVEHILAILAGYGWWMFLGGLIWGFLAYINWNRVKQLS